MIKNNKKIITTIAIILIAIAIVILKEPVTNHKKEISYNEGMSIKSSYIIPENLDELEKNSEIIVKGEFNGERKTDQDKNIVGPSSISKFTISDTYKGNINSDTISVLEPFKFEKNNFINIQGYIPMKENQEYILFLRENNTPDGKQYSIISLSLGKYNLSNEEKVSPISNSISTFNEVSNLDLVSQSTEECKIYNDIKSQIISSNKTTHDQILTGQSAFYEFRINPSNKVKYYIDTKMTNKFFHHTNAYNNAINKFNEIEDANISFVKINNKDSATIELSSVNSSKEEWVGIAEVIYNEFNNPVPTVTKANVFLNENIIVSSNLTEDHTYEVALHELGHSFGLLHQNQSYDNETIMAPYIMQNRDGRLDLTSVDKENLINAYPIPYDWKQHWAKDTIEKFINKGYISGYDDGLIKPNNKITRAEFVSVLNNALGLTKSSNKVFKDTKNHWAKSSIDVAVTNGVCNGKSNEIFDPNGYITREEAAVMVSNYKQISDTNHDKLSTYNDNDKISSWAKSGVEYVVEKGYMNGYSDNTFRPKDKITRGEAIVTLSRVKT